MRPLIAIGVVVAWFLAPPGHAQSQRIAALQVALRAHGLYAGQVDGIAGPLTRSGLVRLQKRRGLAVDARIGPRTRRALGRLGKPLLGRRELWIGRVGWDVSALEFRLLRFGLPRRAVDGRFTALTARALRRFQRAHGLFADGIAGLRTFRALARSKRRSLVRYHVVSPGEGFIVIARRYGVRAGALSAANGLTLASVLVPGQRLRLPPAAVTRLAASSVSQLVHVVRQGESFFSIAERYGVSPWDLARQNGVHLDRVIVPGMRLTLPEGAHGDAGSPPPPSPSLDAVRWSIDRWSSVYGVDARLARALAWMESGFQNHVVSPVGARGVMQLLPETWEFVETVLLGTRVPETADGNVHVGVRYLRWQLDYFGGDVPLALAGWYQGARAVGERGIFDDTREFVRIVLALYGKV